MVKVIVCGKGGCGKSTVTSLLADCVSRRGKTVFVMDSDESNTGLNKMLGVEKPEKTLIESLGGRQEVKKLIQNDGFKDKMGLSELPQPAVVWKDKVGFMEVGKIEHFGEGCACMLGMISRKYVDNIELSEDQWVIIDTEAGVEHFGRGVGNSADCILMVADPSEDSILLADKIKKISAEANKPFFVIVNKANEKMAEIVLSKMSGLGIDVIGVVPLSVSLAESNIMCDPIRCSDDYGSISKAVEAIEKTVN